MLSLEKCREILGKDCDLSDSDLQSLRDQLYGLADVGIESFLESKRNKVNLPTLTEAEREAWQERMGIMEFDGKMERAEAETAAFNLWREAKDPK